MSRDAEYDTVQLGRCGELTSEPGELGEGTGPWGAGSVPLRRQQGAAVDEDRARRLELVAERHSRRARLRRLGGSSAVLALAAGLFVVVIGRSGGPDVTGGDIRAPGGSRPHAGRAAGAVSPALAIRTRKPPRAEGVRARRHQEAPARPAEEAESAPVVAPPPASPEEAQPISIPEPVGGEVEAPAESPPEQSASGEFGFEN